jgi:hypothetical protein
VSEKVVVVNTHPGENPEFVGKLVDFMHSLDIEPEVVEGYEHVNPLDGNPSHIILTGVPADAHYSLKPLAGLEIANAQCWVFVMDIRFWRISSGEKYLR